VELRCDPPAAEESASMIYEVYSVSDFPSIMHGSYHGWKLSRNEACMSFHIRIHIPMNMNVSNANPSASHLSISKCGWQVEMQERVLTWASSPMGTHAC